MGTFNMMDPLMKALRAANQSKVGQTELSEDQLKKERASVELASRLATPPVGVTATPIQIGNISAEWITPDYAHDRKHIIMYNHGGGYTSGALGYARILAAKLALHTGLAVLSYEYRLAPENPYPAAFEDGMEIWNYLMLQGYGASDIIMAGDSAGGNLTLELTLALKEAKRKLPRALVLFSPWTDMTASNPSYESKASLDPILTIDYIVTVRNAYVGADADFKDPKLSPLFADLTNMPPTLIQVGDNEVLLDDSVLLHKKLIESGCSSILQEYPDGWHVFQQMPLPMSIQAVRDASEYIHQIIY